MSIKASRREFIAIALLLAICLVTVFVVNEVFVAENGGTVTDTVAFEKDHFNDGYIEVNIRTRVIDLEKERIALEMDFVPHGRFDGGDSLLAVPLEIEISSVNNTRLLFEAGRRMYPVEVEISFYEGEVEQYPFDEHRALLEILIDEETSADDKWTPVPTQLNFEGSHHSYSFTDKTLPPSQHGYLGLDIHMRRSPLVIETAIFWMATIWGLTIINLILLIGVMKGYVKPDFSLFGYMSGFIVAMYFFREMFPDIPSFLGVFSDYLSIFWAILVAAGIANVVAFKWFIAVFKDEDKQPDSI